MEIDGTGITSRKGVGESYIYSPEEPEVEEETDKSPEEEKQRFHDAIEEAEEQLHEEAEQTEEKAGEDDAEIFEAQVQFLKDPQIEENVKENIGDGMSAEKAVKEGFGDPIDQLESQDGRIGERADDLRDVRDRVIRILSGGEKEALEDIPEGSVLVAERLTPSDTSDLDREMVEGIVTAEGSRTAHAAILARSMRIPAVIGAGDISGIEEGDRLLVDAESGKTVVDPAEDRVEDIETQNFEVIEQRVETEDGEEIGVAANVANPGEVEKAVDQGADGIGLYRTEFMFLDREDPPGEDEHLEHYTQALEKFEERVIVRTLDIGGDKEVPYLDLDRGENPFLGPRGIRLAFNEGEELFRTQMRALLRAASGENGDRLAVMFPLVSSVKEVEDALSLIEELEEELEEEGQEYDRPEIGVMVETPSAVEIAGELAKRVGFLSIGTNDLTQYTMAASRTDSRVADLQDPLYPSVLRSIRETVEKGHGNGAWVGMCGEMAGNPELTELLVSIGIDELSMASGVVPEVKGSVQDSSTGYQVEDVLQAATREEVREKLDLG